ncbi:MAG TPA: type II toxin-antitoxin system prevent-host-death family antitoxin [Allosphingosinicella sp.]|jgi:prevent-host-death family protein
MAALSIRELNANISKVIERVEGGEVVDVSRNGRVVAEIRPKIVRPVRDARYWKARKEMERLLTEGLPLNIGKASIEDRYGDADL